MKKVVITGATSMLGSALAKECVSQGIDVLAIVRNDSAKLDKIVSIDGIKTISANINEYDGVLLDDEYDVMYHFAWEGTSKEDRNDRTIQQRNIGHTINAVKMAKRLGCKKFIGAGSQAEYGLCNDIITYNTETNPVTEYGKAKLSAGVESKKVAIECGIEHIWARIFSIYGPNDSDNTLIMSLIKQLKEGKTPKMTKAEQIWDYLYSADAARAFLLLGHKNLKHSIYCIGSGEGRPLIEYTEIIRRMINPKAKIKYGSIPYSKNQITYLCADISELQTDTGFKPLIDFETGAELTINSIIGEKNEKNISTDSDVQ